MSKNVVKHAVILAGGKGTRLAEQTKSIPKPLVEVGNIPILAHIINHLVSYGVEHIVIAGGYKVDLIREYFMSDRYKYRGSVTIGSDGHFHSHEPFLPRGLKTLTVADTGLSTGTAQRIKKAAEYFTEENVPFYMTYGDSVSNVNLDDVMETHFKAGTKLTLTGVQYQERFGVLSIDKESNQVTKFAEKSMSVNELINGGFMILNPSVLESIGEGDNDFSKDTMPRLQAEGQITAHVHLGFWAAMDTQRDYEELNKIYDKNPELFHR